MIKKLYKNSTDKELQYIPLTGNKVYSTYDLGSAASLVTAGFTLLTLDKINPHKVQFIFSREAGIEKIVDDYWADRLTIKARTFFDNTKMLKNRIYSE